jgi:Protein of unknown function (DUF3102)
VVIENAGGDHLPALLVSDTPDLADRRFDSRFDYDVLASDTANALRERRAEIRGAVKKTAEAVIAIGRNLMAAKKILGHGRFVDWVEMECGFRIRTAQNYMAISRLSANYAFVAYLPVGTVLRLGRSRVRRELLDRISTSMDTRRPLTEDEFCALHEKLKKMRQLEPKRSRRGRPNATPKPVERPSEKYAGHTKTEYAEMNAKHIKERWGYECLLFFRLMIDTDTVADTRPFIEVEIQRFRFERGLADLRESATQE